MVGYLCFGTAKDISERYQPAAAIGNFDPDGALAGNRREETNIRGGERIGDVVGEPGDARHLDPRCQLDLIAGHGRAGNDLGEPGVDTVLAEGLLQFASRVLQCPPAVGSAE